MNTLEWKDFWQGSYAFVWEVAAYGYRLADSDAYRVVDVKAMMEGSDEPRHIDSVDVRPPWLLRKNRHDRPSQYPPLSKYSLHRTFGDLKDDEELLGFANQYGLLGIGVNLAPVQGGAVEFGESLERWHSEIRAMGSMLQILDWIGAKDGGKLGQIFTWLSKDRLVLHMQTKVFAEKGKPRVVPWKGWRNHTPMLGGYSESIEPQLLKLWGWGDVIGPAKYYVCREVNKKLRGHVSPQVHPFADKVNRLGLWPSSLLSAMWLMFMWEMTGRTKMLLCPRCGKWSEREDPRRLYCSQACRQKAYEENQKKRKGKQ